MTARPRYGRITAFGAAVLVTLVSVLGGLGVLPSGGHPSYASTRSGDAAASLSAATVDEDPDEDPVEDESMSTPTGRPRTEPTPGEDTTTTEDGRPAVPYDSGAGKRVVFSMSQQRVWLVEDDESVKRTYLVSGSIYDNLAPGVYEVYDRSMDAVGIEDSGTMKYMVRFAHGANAAIGFHDIPISHGKRVQTREELGTPLSHGCIRQWRPDAKALWDFAPVGTEVDVVA